MGRGKREKGRFSTPKLLPFPPQMCPSLQEDAQPQAVWGEAAPPGTPVYLWGEPCAGSGPVLSAQWEVARQPWGN